jgi:hypothetical protein
MEDTRLRLRLSGEKKKKKKKLTGGRPHGNPAGM